MDNEYLDTYIGKVRSLETEEIEELVLVRAVSTEHANEVVLRNVELTPYQYLEVKRHQHPRLVASPSDIVRNRSRKRRSGGTPQYRATTS